MYKSNVTFMCYVIWLDKKVKAYPTRIIDTYMKDYKSKMDEISKLTYEGNLELLKLKLRDDNSLATKPDEVTYSFHFKIKLVCT